MKKRLLSGLTALALGVTAIALPVSADWDITGTAPGGLLAASLIVKGTTAQPEAKTVVFDKTSGFTYDATAQGPAVSIDGLTAGTDYTVTYEGTGGTTYVKSGEKPVHAGSYQVKVTLTQAGAEKYTLANGEAAFSIQPKEITVAARAGEKLTKVYDGTTKPPKEFLVSDYVQVKSGDLAAADAGKAQVICDAAYDKAGIDATKLVLSKFALADSDDYVIKADAIELPAAIVQAEMTAAAPRDVTVKAGETIIGKQVQSTAVGTGAEKIDGTYKVVSGTGLDASTKAESGKSYDVKWSFTPLAEQKNYKAFTGQVSGTIKTEGTKTDKAVVFEGLEATYNKNAQAPKVTIEGLKAGEDYTVAYTQDAKAVAAPMNAGTYQVTVTLTSQAAERYQLTNAAATFVIKQAQVTEKAVENIVLEDSEDGIKLLGLEVKGTATGVDGETVEGKYILTGGNIKGTDTAIDENTRVEIGKDYAIFWTFTPDNANYAPKANIPDTISTKEQKAITINEFTAEDKTYDEKAYNPDLIGYTFTGFDRDTLPGRFIFEGTKDTQYAASVLTPINAGTYKVTLELDASLTDEYVLAGTTYAEFTIHKEAVAAPSGITVEKCTEGKDNGVIKGLKKDTLYEYSADEGETWIKVDANSTQITNLKAGTYQLRVRPPVIDLTNEDGTTTTVPDPNRTSEALTLTVAEKELAQYWVRYDMNGGKAYSVPDKETVTEGTSVVIKGRGSKSGYTFEGWKSNKGKYYESGDTITVNSNVTLTAQYTKNYSGNNNNNNDSNGNSGSGGRGALLLASTLNNNNNNNGATALAHKAYMEGYTDGTFLPDNNITRGETAAIFSRVNSAFSQESTYGANFYDVAAGQWYANYIGFVSQKGIVTGKEDGSFDPDAAITRAEFAAMAARYLGLNGGGASPFWDASGHWAEGYITQLAAKGVIGGYGDNTFHPDEPITRAEAVKIMNGVLGRNVTATGLANASYKRFSDVAQSHWAYYAIAEAANNHSYLNNAGMEVWK